MKDIELRKNQAILGVFILCLPIIMQANARIMEGIADEPQCRVYHASAPADKRCDNSEYKEK